MSDLLYVSGIHIGDKNTTNLDYQDGLNKVFIPSKKQVPQYDPELEDQVDQACLNSFLSDIDTDVGAYD